ncbi:MAG TPA: hypothetical protein VLG67_04395 [Candidatus Saccharimonadales bacterium]|nr:hypothetical protein [Candidatus Saccharimonadales bacterium]
MNNELSKEQILNFVKTQWKPLLLGGLIVIGLLITLIIPRGKSGLTPKPGNSISNSNNKSNTPTKTPFNLFGIFNNSQNKDKGNTKPQQDTNLKNINSGNPTASIPTVIKTLSSNGTTISQTLSTSGVTQTAQGTINPNGNIQTGVDSSTQPDKIAIVFKNPDGTTTTYFPPGTPPDEVRWGRYTNTKSKYAINYPVNWQFVYSVDGNGFEGVALYPPGVNPNDRNSPHIGFGMSSKFLMPAGESEGSLITPVTVDGNSGKLYTNGPLGDSYIASVLNYSDNYFGLAGTKSDATFAYVYYYMIYSLTFNTE